MIEVIISAMRLVAQDIISLEFVRADGGLLPPVEAGAHVDVHLPGGLIRQYSLWNQPGAQSHYCIGVLKDPASRGGSKAVHENLRVGMRVQISEPRNLFPLEEGVERSLLFAGGIGITPILCMAQELAAREQDFELHYCARSTDRAAFVEWLKVCDFADHVRFHFDNGPDQQKLNAAALLAAEAEGTHLYVCGPGGFMGHVLDTAKEQGWADNRLHREYFAAAPNVSADDGSFEVRIHSTGQVLQVPADQTVSQVLDAAGIIVPVSCEQGICGTCITRVVDGEPDHRDFFLTDAEKAKNDQFTPCCSRAKSACLVLDL
uniref:Vanillate O-demethylase oxidoreductase n=1 Tax=Pseudomonas sp. (strain HR199 / DSM 7063) TaxID=86003 RepID=VANB_PSEUH|nr:RecName: Full=Vanillate O-demethylase oxidoreductase; AltName: Full=Vanillate degradation ferredoxin-like protein [Pseudomonas sp. HR199]CAA72288.1 reductase-subunit oxygenase [Pseudomonas sp.]